LKEVEMGALTIRFESKLTSPLDAVEQKGGTLRNAKTTLMVKKDEMPRNDGAKTGNQAVPKTQS